MLGKQNPQTSFMDLESWFGKPIVPPDSIYGLLAEWGDRLIQESDFAAMFSSIGRPSVSPALLSKVLLLMYHDNVTDREAEERAQYDLRWKVALHLPMQEAGFDYTSLSRFRMRLLVNKQQQLVFERFLRLAKDTGIIKDSSLQIIGSSHILGAAAVKDTYIQIKTAIQKALTMSYKQQGQSQQAIQSLVMKLDYTPQGTENIDWDDRQIRQQLLQNLVDDSQTIMAALVGIELSLEEKLAFDILATVTEQDIVTTDDGKVAIRPGAAPDSMMPAEDPEQLGHKVSTGKVDGKGQLVIDETTKI